ncbi:hypothetical protein ACLIBG_01585 [Virgibacillus sp. W0181]|uniref:hypothetical protein n=1 Tax=Virgibacillus sp. W0181 TaxID=3391581 RepID=UPI003F48D36E
MTTRNKYYVTIDAKEVRTSPLPDGTNYTILATEDEAKELRMIFTNMENESKEALKHILKPFDERPVDIERNKYDTDLLYIYQRVHDLGTEETKLSIKQLGLF